MVSSRQVSTLAGLGGAAGAIDGIGTSARFDVPSCIAVDSSATFVLVVSCAAYPEPRYDGSVV